MKLSIIITFILFGISSYAQNDSILYSFFVAGHTYGKPGVNNVGFHPPFKKKFGYIQGRHEIKFGVLTGDIVSPFPIAQDWDEIDADIDTLGIPVYFAVGNHDMENRPIFESRYGSTYYYFIYQNDLFIVLDPNIDEWNISGAQLLFLQNTIEDNSSTTDNIYIFFHQILWRETDNLFNYIHWNSSAGRGETVNFWTEIEPIFRNLPNEVIMFAGDLGASWSTDVTYDHYDNITLIASGMGDEDGENFIVVNVDSSKSVHYDLICLSDTNINCLGMLKDYLVVSEVKDIKFIANNTYNAFIYPNPAHSNITISQKVSSKTIIQFYNIQGVLILEEKINGKFKHSINISHIPKGFYIVKIFNNLYQSSIKLIKE